VDQSCRKAGYTDVPAIALANKLALLKFASALAKDMQRYNRFGFVDQDAAYD
jgi:hypothetical protein